MRSTLSLISHKRAGKIFGPNLSPENPTRTVFAIMISSLHKKLFYISRLIPCASITAEYLFPIIKSCILDIESYCLIVQIISTDNYPLNVNLFKLFSPSRQLETSVHTLLIIQENSLLLLTLCTS